MLHVCLNKKEKLIPEGSTEEVGKLIYIYIHFQRMYSMQVGGQLKPVLALPSRKEYQANSA